MNLRSSIEHNHGEHVDNVNERFMIVVPEALHSFPVCQEFFSN
jgi:hypothetical protein